MSTEVGPPEPPRPFDTWGSLRERFAGPAPFWLTRFAILRLLGLIYTVAFLNVVSEALPLIGADGLLPAHLFLDRVAEAKGGAWEGFVALPS
ncbi:MAG: lipase maturation factor family protein, partial [Myxococcota bacterium]|nr:lipase maturation factor family protein [Myxococcota bacterium]